jgi:hypothetical protein
MTSSHSFLPSGRPRPRVRRVAACAGLAAVLTLLATTAVATAERPATAVESRAIRTVLLKNWRTNCGSRPFSYRGAHVSAVDARFAIGSIVDNTCTYTFGFFLRRPSVRSESWRIILGFGDSAEPCSEFTRVMPERVVRDFKLEGASTTSGFGRC